MTVDNAPDTNSIKSESVVPAVLPRDELHLQDILHNRAAHQVNCGGGSHRLQHSDAGTHSMVPAFVMSCTHWQGKLYKSRLEPLTIPKAIAGGTTTVIQCLVCLPSLN